jgi:hypothetical protein
MTYAMENFHTHLLFGEPIVKVVNLCKRRGFKVQICLMDNEFEVIRAPLLEHRIPLPTLLIIHAAI